MNGQQLLGFLRKNIVTCVCAVLSLAVIGVIFFRSDALSEAEAELKEKTDLAQRYSTNLNHATQLKEHYEALVAANKEIEDRFVHVTQLAQNLQYFYKIEADTGVKMIVNPLPQPVTAPGAAKTTAGPVGFTVSVQGDFLAVVEFLRRIEDGARISRILSCTMSAAGIAGIDTGSARKISLNLNLELLGLP